jgi:hypothetical protein
MKTAEDIISIIVAAGADSSEQIQNTLEDGATLALLGITDEDEAAVETAYAIVKHEQEDKEETAADTIARLVAWRAAKPWRHVQVSWRWAGREKLGLVALLENGQIILESTFRRESQEYRASDSDFTSCKTDSSKHRSLVDLANFIGA